MHYFLTEACYAKIAGLKNIGKNMQVISVTNSQRKAWNKQTIIFLSDVALFFILLNTLPLNLRQIRIIFTRICSHFMAYRSRQCNDHCIVRAYFICSVRIS